MAKRIAMPYVPPSPGTPGRLRIAVGIIRRRGGRTTTVRATAAGVTGTIRTGGAR